MQLFWIKMRNLEDNTVRASLKGEIGLAFFSSLKKFFLYQNTAKQESFTLPLYPDDLPKAPQGDGRVSARYEKNLAWMKNRFSIPENNDMVLREFTLKNGVKAFLVHIDGMVKSATVNEFILKPLMLGEFSGRNLKKQIGDTIQINSMQQSSRLAAAEEGILIGDTAVFVDGVDQVYVCETKGFDKRSVGKAENESSIKGSQEAFAESIRTNTTLIRRIVRSPDLITEFIQIGTINRNPCAVMYLKGLTNPALVDEVKRRISSLKSDFLYGSGMVEQMIEDGPFRLLPNLLATERPDAVALHLCQGRVAVLVEGTPEALVMPVGIVNLIKSPEDAQMRWQYATVTRFTRALAVSASALLPGFFVAIVNFHRGMIPTELLIAIAKTQENVPLPAMVEMLLMEFAFELIREAGIRVPGVIGGTIGIVGGLILGQAAVSANLISPLTIIVIAMTGISSFAIPDFSFSFGIRMIRVLLIFLAGCFGFVGMGLGIVAAVGLTCAQKNFGVGEFSPLSPKTKSHSFFVYAPPPWKKEFRPDEVNPARRRNQPHISRRWILGRKSRGK